MSANANTTLETLGLSDRVRKAYAQALDSMQASEDSSLIQGAAQSVRSDDASQETRDVADATNLVLGRIVRLDRGFPLVATGSGERRAQAATDLVKNADTLGVIGDWVIMRDDPDHDMGVIEQVLPRKGELVRKDPGEQTAPQTIAANIDTVFIMQSLSGDGVNVRRLEREMVMAYESGAEPVILLTKADVVQDDDDAGAEERVEEQVELAETHAPGVPVLALSAETGEGVDELAETFLKSGETSIMLGESGVGKSTLINALLGEDKLATAAVREHDDRGRHTTVAREMIVLPNGAIIIDSPGIRSIALWSTEEGIAEVFQEISSRADLCKFRDCTHTTEPGCQILAALEAGEITQDRYDAYRVLIDENEKLQLKQEDKQRTAQDRKREDKAFSKHKKNYHRDYGKE